MVDPSSTERLHPRIVVAGHKKPEALDDEAEKMVNATRFYDSGFRRSSKVVRNGRRDRWCDATQISQSRKPNHFAIFSESRGQVQSLSRQDDDPRMPFRNLRNKGAACSIARFPTVSARVTFGPPRAKRGKQNSPISSFRRHIAQ